MNLRIKSVILVQVMQLTREYKCLICQKPFKLEEISSSDNSEYLRFLCGIDLETSSHYHCLIPLDRDKLTSLPLEELVSTITPHQHVLTQGMFRQSWCSYWKTWRPPLPIKDLQTVISIVGTENWLEVGAGSGLQALVWQKAGVNFCGITDLQPEEYGELDEPPFWSEKLHPSSGFNGYLPVEKCSAKEAIAKYTQAKVLFICWSKNLTYEDVNQFNGQFIVEIGDSQS